ncbi:MAG: tetraacyldisaccharide 4'-kinase [Chromatiales bacterium]|nr:tetraacyldisaccharide 4'-kinase [Chromatiales bacterium]
MTPPEAAPGPERWLQALWYGRSPLAWLLLPIAGLFALVTGLRRLAYRVGWLAVHRLPVPVIVVGNITVGGTGKTPVTAWLAALFREAGLRPGIVSRGYGGRPSPEPRLVCPDDDAAVVGDEPLLLHRQTGTPVCVHPDRVAAGRRLLAEGVNVVIADDGLQHYRLHRDLEIVVLDGERRLGNGFLLPAGPLREGASRLRAVDLVLVTGGPAEEGEFPLQYGIGRLRALDGSVHCGLEVLRGQVVRAVAGIGNPGRFHAQLAAAGVRVEPVPVPDHGRVDLQALARSSGVPIVMTEKDAVKYRPVHGGCPVWVAGLELGVPEVVGARILARLRGVKG